MRLFRILFVAPVPNFKGGAERSLLDLLTNPGVDPCLVVPAEGPISATADALGIPWDVVDFGNISEIRRPFRLRDGFGAVTSLIRAARNINHVARRRGAEVVHSNGLKAHAISLVARRIGGLPTVIHIRDIANTKNEKAVWKAFQIAADQTILVSRACCPENHLPRNVHVVYNGFSVGGSGPGEENKVLRSYLVLGFTAGRIHPSKGLHVLLDSVAHARALNCDVRLIVRGAFAEESPAYEAEIRNKIAALNLSELVRLERFVDVDDVYKDIDIVCVPSTAPDPLPRTVMEAMGHGLVVIAAPCGGIPEMIIDGENGFLTSEPSCFASVVARLQNDPSLRLAIGRKARAHCEAHFGLDRLHREVRQVYELAAR
jgi:glycosyltransferase involved in cell wall biosynthesis